nr:hypothetical protein [Tanacetum cinerariifolium]
ANNLPQLLDSRGGSRVTNVLDFDKEDFTSWKVRGQIIPSKMIDWPLCMESTIMMKDRDSDVKEDQRTSDEFMVGLNDEYHERALLANQKRFYKRERVKRIKKSKKGLIAESFDWDEESISSYDEWCTKIRAFMEIVRNESLVGKDDARSGQWVDITIEKVHRLLSMTDCDERKHVLDYTHVDLHYVEDQRKNLVNKFNLLKQEISLHKSELSNLKNTMSINCSLQNEVIRENLENKSLKDEIIDLKKEPFPPLPKLIGAAPSNTLEYIISLSNLTLNMADLTLDIHVPKKTRPSVNVSTTYVIKKKTEKSPTIPIPCSDKKADLSTQQLLLTLMEEVKGLKKQIKIPSGTLSLSSQPSSSKSNKQKTCFGPCKHCGFKNHLSDDCYSKPKCSTYGSTDHLTKEHLEHVDIKKTLSKIKAESPMKPSLKRAPMILKPFKECKYYGYNDHHSNDSEIKVVKSFLTSHFSELQEDSNSDLQSMPDDDLRSVSGFEAADSDDNWSVEDKILVPKPPKNCARCAKCGHPNTSESSDDSTNVVNAPREPVVVKKDHGVNPPHIDECCCECGNALDGIYCQ